MFTTLRLVLSPRLALRGAGPALASVVAILTAGFGGGPADRALAEAEDAARAAEDAQAAQAADDGRFVLHALTIDGVSAYPLGDLAPLYANELAREISVADLAGVAQALTDHYRRDGYFLARASTPRQTSGEGHARLVVYEGYVGEVAFDGDAVPAVGALLADIVDSARRLVEEHAGFRGLALHVEPVGDVLPVRADPVAVLHATAVALLAAGRRAAATVVVTLETLGDEVRLTARGDGGAEDPEQHLLDLDVEAIRAIRQAEVGASRTMLDRTAERFGLKPQSLAADSAYGSAENLAFLVKQRGIAPHIPVFDKSNRTDGTLSRSDFAFDPEQDRYTCPVGKHLVQFHRTYATQRSGITKEGTRIYRASKRDCDGCALKPRCCPNTPARKIPRDLDEDARDVARALAGTPAYERSRHRRKKVEMLFAHLKRILRLGRLRLRGPSGARDEFLLAATAQNLRKLAKLRSMTALA